MRRRLGHLLLLTLSMTAMICLFMLGANAYTYPSMPSNWQDVKVTVGDVTMPLSRYPDGAYYDPEKRYMTVEEQADYGISVGSPLDLRGWECVGFARYVYSALFYKYPQNATIDTGLAYEYRDSYAYRNMIYEVLGTKTLASGYSASTLKTLITSCEPGAVMRIGGHSLVIMGIFDDGIIVYDANYSSNNEVDVRMYTWQSFINSLGSRDIYALQMPAYYPGYSYSTGNTTSDDYTLDYSTAGSYEVYDCTVLNVRAKPSTSGTLVGTLASGTVVDVQGSYNGWAKITFQGNGRWIYMDYLKAVSSEVSVTFDANGGSASATTGTYQAGDTFGTMPSASKSNRTLLGWSDGNTLYTASSRVPAVSTLTLKAQWCVLGFQDVLENSWYASSVENVANLGVISSSSMFYPDEAATRAQLVTVLGREYERESGSQISSGSTNFYDVPSGVYYEKYVAWGYQAGIVKGTSETSFSPDTGVTREQIAEFLYRLAKYNGLISGTVDTSKLSGFDDGTSVSSYAQTSVCWALEQGIIKGDDQNCLNPQKSAKRSEMIIMISRYVSYAGSALGSQVTITYDANGGTASATQQRYLPGATFGTMPTATKNNRSLLGWYDGNTCYSAGSTVPAWSLKLKARWCVMGYTDVLETDWYASAVEQCAASGLLDSVSTFGPMLATTRSEAVTYLGRAYEHQTGTTIPRVSSLPFTDVSSSASYARYVAWGNANALVMGVADGQFAPDTQASRAQIATFLYRLAKFTGLIDDSEVDTSVLSRFSDGAEVPEVFQKSVSWAISAGILSGDDSGCLRPTASATHAQIAVMMIRYLNYAGV